MIEESWKPRTPQEGGKAHSGPFSGRVLAYDKMSMPVTNNAGKRIGTYYWMDGYWEYEEEDDKDTELYP